MWSWSRRQFLLQGFLNHHGNVGHRSGRSTQFSNSTLTQPRSRPGSSTSAATVRACGRGQFTFRRASNPIKALRPAPRLRRRKCEKRARWAALGHRLDSQLPWRRGQSRARKTRGEIECRNRMQQEFEVEADVLCFRELLRDC